MLEPATERSPGVSQLRVLSTRQEVRDTTREWRRDGLLVGSVMTMGALHRGHLALVDAAAHVCDRVVVSIYVNPLQFGAGEDYTEYPRDLTADVTALQSSPCDVVFAPTDAEVLPSLSQPQGLRTRISVFGLSERLCGLHRPGHFDGMATEVMAQLMILEPHFTFLGDKDYQQRLIVERLVQDLNIPVTVRGVPTVREPDGLALSSRNTYLTPHERAVAPALHRALQETLAAMRSGSNDVPRLLEVGRSYLLKRGFDAVNYFELVDGALEPLAVIPDYEARLVVAARLGKTRLVDNIPVSIGDIG